MERINPKIIKIVNYLKDNDKLWCNEVYCFDDLLNEDQIDGLAKLVDEDNLPKLEPEIIFFFKHYNVHRLKLEKLDKMFSPHIQEIINLANNIKDKL
jgi:hypothetical protein